MKFSNVITERERSGPLRWAGHYIAYKRLKKCLKTAVAGSAEAESHAFLAELKAEVDRLNSVVLAEKAEIDAAHREISRIRLIGDISAARSGERLLWKRMSELREFVELAYETVYKAVKYIRRSKSTTK